VKQVLNAARQISVAAKHTFTFEWTVANTGSEPFGKPVHRLLSPVELVRLLGEVGAWA
jgi:hypothetical protein